VTRVAFFGQFFQCFDTLLGAEFFEVLNQIVSGKNILNRFDLFQNGVLLGI
jgi:hypothetical protein